jgi:hypothetical protein
LQEDGKTENLHQEWVRQIVCIPVYSTLGMEPTNNLEEQAMREHVIMRKIIGTFRSENGSANYQYIASALATWKLQGKNPFEELESLLRMELCLK